MVTITLAEHERLRDRIRTLEGRCGHLMVDADRREERAWKTAESCAEHGREITHLRHLSSWYWAASGHADACRQAIVMAMFNLADNLRHDRVDPAAIPGLLDKAVHVQSKVLRRPPGYPTLADCLRGGGCEHDGLAPGLAAEIATELGVRKADQ